MASTPTGSKMPKSILKKSSKPSEDAIAARNRELAVHHALVIQRQKDVESAILDSVEALIEYPINTIDPAHPHPSDIEDVKRHFATFRPSDFDSVVEERNLDEKCGYVLCPRPRIKQNTSAKYRLLQGRNLRVVKTSELEKWCSKDCAKRALYLRVQLDEAPPWERAANIDGKLELYGEAQASHTNEDMDHMTDDLQRLALERGDPMNSFRAKSVGVDLQERFENMAIDQPIPPNLTERTANDHIEGYRYGMTSARNRDPLDLDMIKDDGDIIDSI